VWQTCSIYITTTTHAGIFSTSLEAASKWSEVVVSIRNQSDQQMICVKCSVQRLSDC